MARTKVTISEESDEVLRGLMESREISLGEAADLAIKVGCNRLAALDRHKKKKAPAKKQKKAPRKRKAS
jgi:hypothetical protein